MNTSSITRKIDEFGRIVIPKEIRQNLNIKSNEEITILTENNNIILVKTKTNKTYLDMVNKLINIVKKSTELNLIVTDKEYIINTTKEIKLLGKKLPEKFSELIEYRLNYDSKIKEKLSFEDIILNGYFSIYPIVISNDCYGLVTIYSKNKIYEHNLLKILVRIIIEKVDID